MPADDAGTEVAPAATNSGCGCALADRRPSDGFALLALLLVGLLSLGRGTRKKLR